MKNIFISLSGADENILRQCGENENSERTKYTNYGLTVAIPALLSGISFGYAISTFVSKTWIFISAGFLWACIIFVIDRFLISTLYKSELQSRWSFYFAFVMRFLFSFVIGLIISHPMVLFIFGESIQNHIEEKHRDKYNDESNKYGNEIQEIIQKYQTNIETQNTTIECKTRLIHAEKYLDKSEQINYGTITCGISSGNRGCKKGSSCDTYTQERDTAQIELKRLIKERDDQINAIKILQTQAEADSLKIHYDYLTRTQALEELMENHAHVWWAAYMLIIAFVLLDTLLVILKSTNAMGAYEYRKDTLLKGFKYLQYADAKVEEEYAKSIYFDTRLRLLDGEATVKRVSKLPSMINKYIKQQEEQELFFHNFTQKSILEMFLKKLNFKKPSDFEEKKIRETNEMFYKACEKSREELFKHIDP